MWPPPALALLFVSFCLRVQTSYSEGYGVAHGLERNQLLLVQAKLVPNGVNSELFFPHRLCVSSLDKWTAVCNNSNLRSGQITHVSVKMASSSSQPLIPVVFNGSSYVDGILKDAEELLHKHYKSFLPSAFATFATVVKTREDADLISTLGEIVRDRARSVQQKADSIQNLIWKRTKITVIERGAQGGRTSGQNYTRRNSAQDKGVVKENVHELKPVGSTLGQISIPGQGVLNKLIALQELKTKKEGVAFASRSEAVAMCTESFSTEQPCAILVLADRGEANFWHSKDITEKYKISRVALETEPVTPESTLLPRTRVFWLINFGVSASHYVAELEALEPPDTTNNEIVEIALRLHEDHSEATFFQALKSSPVKMANEAVRAMLPPESYSESEVITKAYYCRAKPGEAPKRTVLAFLRIPVTQRDVIFALSGSEGIVASSARSKDQEIGFSVLRLPEEQGPQHMQYWKNLLGETFRGLVPLNQEWSQWGVRFPTTQLEGVRAAISTQQEGDPQVDFDRDAANGRFTILSVPKKWSRAVLSKWLNKKLDWTVAITGDSRSQAGAEYQNYYVTAMAPPVRSITNYGGDFPIEVIKDDGQKTTGTNKISRWAAKVVAAGKSAPAIVAQAQPPDLHQNGSDEMDADEDDTLATKLKKLGRQAQRTTPYAPPAALVGKGASKGKGKAQYPAFPEPTMIGSIRQPASTTGFNAEITTAIDAAVAKRFDEMEERISNREQYIEGQAKEVAKIKRDVMALQTDVREVKKEQRKVQSTTDKTQRMLELLLTKQGIPVPTDDDELSTESAGKKAKT